MARFPCVRRSYKEVHDSHAPKAKKMAAPALIKSLPGAYVCSTLVHLHMSGCLAWFASHSGCQISSVDSMHCHTQHNCAVLRIQNNSSAYFSLPSHTLNTFYLRQHFSRCQLLRHHLPGGSCSVGHVCKRVDHPGAQQLPWAVVAARA